MSTYSILDTLSGKVIGTIEETIDDGDFFFTATMSDGRCVALHWPYYDGARRAILGTHHRDVTRTAWDDNRQG